MIQDNVIGVEVPLEIPDVPHNMAMVGAIELCGTEAIMASAVSCKCQVRMMMHDM